MAFKPRNRITSAVRVGEFRSGLEANMARGMTANGVSFEYERHVIHYVQPESFKRYTPDFVLKNGIVIEGKGRFLTDDRQKHKMIRATHPDLDIRFVFSNPSAKLNKGSETTYADWCERYGFKYARALVPNEWAREKASDVALSAFARATVKPPKK